MKTAFFHTSMTLLPVLAIFACVEVQGKQPQASGGRCISRTAGTEKVLALAKGPVAAKPIIKQDLVFAEADGIVAVEAEHFLTQEKMKARAWYRFDAKSVPRIRPDSDRHHVDGASGGAYLEALPDTRATHDDELKRGENFFDKPGDAGVLTYRVHINHPGRYYVWVRNLSTGSEDNGVHVGIDGTWPESGKNWQTITRRRWSWECRQRTKKIHVGVPMQLYLDIAESGEHKIHFSIREDGFEFDKFLLCRNRDPVPDGVGPRSVVKTARMRRTREKPNDSKINELQRSDSICPPAGRLAIVADGNSPDPDDIGATAVIFGLLNASGLNDRLVHLSHSCDLKPAPRIPAADELRRQGVLHEICGDGVAKYGPFPSLAGYFNCRTDQQAVVNDLCDAINISSEHDPLWIIEAGEPDVIGYALQAADAAKRKHVHVVSHHPANDDSGDIFKWSQILGFGVTEHQIGDQNVCLKAAISPWDWAKEHSDERIQWIWKQLAYAEQDGVVKFQTNHFDCSDAGMVYWWITGADRGGNKLSTPAEIRAMLTPSNRQSANKE